VTTHDPVTLGVAHYTPHVAAEHLDAIFRGAEALRQQEEAGLIPFDIVEMVRAIVGAVDTNEGYLRQARYEDVLRYGAAPRGFRRCDCGDPKSHWIKETP
jgi:hypothetical protein